MVYVMVMTTLHSQLSAPTAVHFYTLHDGFTSPGQKVPLKIKLISTRQKLLLCCPVEMCFKMPHILNDDFFSYLTCLHKNNIQRYCSSSALCKEAAVNGFAMLVDRAIDAVYIGDIVM